MRVAVASGKGGTGKTTVATALAQTAADRGLSAAYVDCDVEAPNGHLLLHPTIDNRQRVTRLVPSVDLDRCERCGICANTCQFGAIVCLGHTVEIYRNLCKSCGACVAACPNSAISEVPYPMGWVETGRAGALRFVQGVLDIGQARAIPVIEAAQAAISGVPDLVVLDAPPGASCPMMTVLREADAVLLVTEATPFGLTDLQIATKAVQSLSRAALVVINCSDLGDRRVHEFCASQGLPVAAEIPYSQEIASSYSNGDLDGIARQMHATSEALIRRLRDMRARRAS